MPPPVPQNTPTDAAARYGSSRPGHLAPEPTDSTAVPSETPSQHSPQKDQTTTKIRRFAPEPIETTARSSRKDGPKIQEKESALRRFVPESIETSHKSSKDKVEQKASSAHIRFKPMLVETTHGGNRKSSRLSSPASEVGSVCRTNNGAPRRFDPVVISTAKRSRRAGDSNAADCENYKTEEGHANHAREHQKHAGVEVPSDTHATASAAEYGHKVSPQNPELRPEARRQIAPLDGRPGPRPVSLIPSRNHSFRCPDLDTIESSGSERESDPSSLSASPGQGSPITALDSSFNEFYKHATRIRESVDENLGNYLLQLEAKKVQQKLLREQALAAYPNSDFHESVRHYVNDDEDSLDMEIEDRPVTWEGFDEEEVHVRVRRESTKVPWERFEMQRHAEGLEQERNANKITAAKKEDPSPWWNPAAGKSMSQPNNELRSMRDRARPPMLGHDLVFPRCPSPEPARFDVTQGCDKLRQQMHYLSQHSEIQQQHEGGLWAAGPEKPDQSFTSAASKCHTKSSVGKGLWGGFCVGSPEHEVSGLMPPTGPTGLMTPAHHSGSVNPFEQSFAGPAGENATLTPPTPPESVHGADPAQIDAILITEMDFDQMFEREFPDSLITQVFNYLSLGYPSLARPFDEELSKISRIPISDLRQDDIKAKQSPRGYIRLGPDFEGGGGFDGPEPDSCSRWHALKLYMREWARQEKDMVRVDSPGGNWATTNRRGSWAW